MTLLDKKANNYLHNVDHELFRNDDIMLDSQMRTVIKEAYKAGANSIPIFKEIRAERKRQDEKFGEQNYPMVGKTLYDILPEDYPRSDLLRRQIQQCKERSKTDQFCWFDILFKEVCEAFLETEPEKQREEMIQVAAVAVAIIEYLDRRPK